MQSTGEWGDFFPPSVSPFAYNETVAHEYYPLTKDTAKQRGYRWKENDQKDYQPQTYTIPENISDVGDDILDAILACESCGKNYKVVPAELEFYRNHRVAVPTNCVDCRHMAKLHNRNPLRIRSGSCRKCDKAIETSYPENTEMQIYCEECYLAEVY